MLFLAVPINGSWPDMERGMHFSPSLLQCLELGQERLERVYDRGQLSVKAVGTLLFSLKKLLAEDFSALLQRSKKNYQDSYSRA